jgi:hypothetical protein
MKVFAAGAVLATALTVTVVQVTSGRPATEARWVAPADLPRPDPVVERVLLQPTLSRISRVAPTATVASALPPAMGARGISIAELDGVVNRYCGSCHNTTRKSGNLVLRGYTLDSLMAHEREIAEKMIVKLRTEMMPPPGSRRPTGDSLLALVETLEQRLDALPVNPGARPFQRLNRPEYERVVADLLGVQVDAGDYLPLDTKSANFDNIADAQALSTTMVESYLNAAAAVSRMTLGDRRATATQVTYRTSPFASQHPWDHVPGTPYGSRGGMVFKHAFPADGEYEFRLNVGGGVGLHLEDLDISIDGEQIALLKYDKGIARNNESADAPAGADYVRSGPLAVKAGQRTVSVAFVRRTEGPYEDLIRPHEWSRASGGTGAAGVTEPPPLMEVLIAGPNNVTGVSDSPARTRLLTCRPTARAEQRGCAERILTGLASRAYRRPLTERDRASLMQFYDQAAAADAEHGFEDGVRAGLQAILASPYFIFRLEPLPEGAKPGTDVRLGDLELASRLSFFLWGTIPDDRLRGLAERGELSKPAVMQAEVRRMLADERARALTTRFAAQWLRLQDLEKVHPDAFLFPDYDAQLAQAMQQETERFFEHLVREDRSFLELYTADYTFVNERLAKHYGIPDVAGPQFRRVRYPNADRRGILGHGSVLVQTSLGNRTSPVLRGKWVMEVLIGTEPPPPPPNVPDLEQTQDAKDGKALTTRDRLAMHAENPTCNACHQYMDPIGLALDAFDVTGRLRYRENGAALDTRGRMYDGMDVASAADLTRSLLSRPLPLARTFTQNLMAYATGRRMEPFDQTAIRRIVAAAAKQDYRISAFVLGVVNSEAFRTRRVEPAVADDVEHDAAQAAAYAARAAAHRASAWRAASAPSAAPQLP